MPPPNDIPAPTKDAMGLLAVEIEREVPRRLERLIDTLPREFESGSQDFLVSRTESMEALFNVRIAALEQMIQVADDQLVDLRSASRETYMKFSEANDRLDGIWSEYEVEGVRGWRILTEKLQAEKDEAEKAALESWRDGNVPEAGQGERAKPTGVECRFCSERSAYRKPTRGLFDDFAGLFRFAPYECTLCGARFYRYRPRVGKRRRLSIL